MKNAYDVIREPRITERTVSLSYGDPRIKDEANLTRKYTFIVDRDANKLEIKQAFETIYGLKVASVNTVKVPGKAKRRNTRIPGSTPDRKKAIITLAKGQVLEDFGV